MPGSMTDGGYRPSPLPRIPSYRAAPSQLPHSETFLRGLTLPELARMLLTEGAGGIRRMIAERILETEDDHRFERDDEIAELDKEMDRIREARNTFENELGEVNDEMALKDNRIEHLEEQLADANDEIARLLGVVRVVEDDLATLKASIDLT